MKSSGSWRPSPLSLRTWFYHRHSSTFLLASDHWRCAGPLRLTQPYVTWSLLVAEFSELAAEVASKYFTETPSGRYAFRPAYNRSVRDGLFSFAGHPGGHSLCGGGNVP